MELIGILVVIIGFVLKLDTLAVVLSAGIVTGLVANMGIVEILDTIGSTFIAQRQMALFLLILPVIGVCERYGLKDRAAELIKKMKGLSTGRLIALYQLIRQITIAMGVRLGQTEFVRPLIEPMAQGAAGSGEETIDEDTRELIKAASAASDNYGNFFAQNIFIANSGVLLITGTLEELGYGVIDPIAVAAASIPVAIIALVFGYLQSRQLDRKIRQQLKGTDGGSQNE